MYTEIFNSGTHLAYSIDRNHLRQSGSKASAIPLLNILQVKIITYTVALNLNSYNSYEK